MNTKDDILQRREENNNHGYHQGMQGNQKRRSKMQHYSRKNRNVLTSRCATIVLYLLALVAVGGHFIRIFDNVFWYDETLALRTMRMDWSGMLDQVARWGHTPLYYILIWIVCGLFGEHGPLIHFVSLVPYIIIVLLSLTIIRKWFGMIPSFVLLLLSSLLENAIRYNVEARMYSWCQLFILLSYLMMYKVICTGDKRYYLLITISSLGAVYTHSFALAAVGILFLFLLIDCEDRMSVWKVIVSGGSVLLLFFPWLIYTKKLKGQYISQYAQITPISWARCFEFIFDSKFSFAILFVYLILLFLTTLYQVGVFDVTYRNNKILVDIIFEPRKWHISSELVWCLAGPAATFGTIFASQLISNVMYPITLERYLYPSMILTWLSLGVCISKCKRARNIISLALAVVLAWSCIPTYWNTVKSESVVKTETEQTFEQIGEMKDGDYILTSNTLSDQLSMVLGYYYPRTICTFARDGSSIPALLEEKNNWIFLGSPITETQIAAVTERGYRAEQVVADGNICGYHVWIYRAVPEPPEEPGLNLILDSNMEVSNSNYCIKEYALSEPIKLNEQYTITIWGTLGEGKTSFDAFLGIDGRTPFASLHKVSDGVYRSSVVLDVWYGTGEEFADNLQIYVRGEGSDAASSISRIKLEKGAFATEWTPVPEPSGEPNENLILDSGKEVSNQEYCINNYMLSEPIELNERYTITIWGTLGEGKTSFDAYIGIDGRTPFASLQPISDGVYRASKIFTTWYGTGEENAANLQIYVMGDGSNVTSSIRKIKLEKGPFATEWTPAP